MSTVNYFITAFVSIVSTTGIVVYIGKRIIDKTLDVGVEKYKNSLDRDLETHKATLLKQTEEFKANLQMIGLEHQIRYTKLHEERGQSMKKLFSLLIELQNKLNYFTNMFQGPEWSTDVARENEAQEAQRDLFFFFQMNRIYYPKMICDEIDEILKLSWHIIVDMSVAKITSANAGTGSERATALREWRDANKRVSSEIESATGKLQDEFKKMLGVE